ncbi:MAG TPA: DNA polymerase Y family protein [Opitutaceae bacterium]|nr:DNA polymerase Y family protein [Opitutaceae bacterium]
MSFAVLYLPHFPLQAVLRTEPDAPGEPAALFAENSRKSVVLAANPAAVSAGVELGMSAPQAVARCPGLRIRTRRPDREAEAQASLLAVGFTLSPSIEDTSPGVCTVNLEGSDPATTDRATAAAVAALTPFGFVASAGIGATPLLATYAARAAASARPSENPGAGVVRAMPGAPVFRVGDTNAFLQPLPLSAADPSPEIEAVLSGWGIRTIGALTSLARDDVGRRLGSAGLELWDRARGGSVRPLRPVSPPQDFSAQMEFEDEIETLEPLLFILRRFLERLTLELRSAGFVAAAMDLAFTLADGTRHERSFRLPEPTTDIEVLFRALHTHLESLRTEASITSVALRALATRPLVRQQGLFETGLRDPHGFADTLARVMAIVGPDRVGVPQSQDTHRPDAVSIVPPGAVVPPASPAPLHPAIGLPLRRFRPPLPARIELTDGRPTYLWTEHFHGPIAEVRGPWLASGEWWQTDRAWRRTEYDVSLAAGGSYRLAFMDHAWFVDGEYD